MDPRQRGTRNEILLLSRFGLLAHVASCMLAVALQRASVVVGLRIFLGIGVRISTLTFLADRHVLVLSVNSFASTALPIVDRSRHVRIPFCAP